MSTTTDRLHGVNASKAIKVPCRVATTANITLSGLQTIDGIALASGDRVLVKDQSTGSGNGIYEASTATWNRALDFDGANDITTGTLVRVTSGTVNALTLWELTTTGALSIGTTSLTFGTALPSTLGVAAAAAAAEAAAAAALTAATNAAAAAADAAALAATLSAGVTVDTFTGDGSTVDFTLSKDPGTERSTLIFIDGVYQEKTAYSVLTTTLTFTAAPPDGSSIEVDIGVALPSGGPTLGALAALDTVSTAVIDNAAVTFAKIQSASTVCLLGATGANPFQQIGIGTGLSLNTGTGILTSSGVGTSSVGQAQLKTSFSEAAVLAPSLDTATVDFVSAGGEYGFATVAKSTATAFGGVTVDVAFRQLTGADATFAQYFTLTATSTGPGATGVGTIRQRYISASPPYDAGDGPMSDFVFVVLKRGAPRTVTALWAAQDPPWAYNGPTRTRANGWADEEGNVYFSPADASAAKTPVVPVIARRTRETLNKARTGGRLADYLRDLSEGELWYEPVTPQTKMRDASVIPHPFRRINNGTHVIVLLDPLDAVTQRLVHLMRHADEAGESISDLVFRGDVRIDNANLAQGGKRWSPPGVQLVKAEIR